MAYTYQDHEARTLTIKLSVADWELLTQQSEEHSLKRATWATRLFMAALHKKPLVIRSKPVIITRHVYKHRLPDISSREKPE